MPREGGGLINFTKVSWGGGSGCDEEDQNENIQHSASAPLEGGRKRKRKITDRETECWVKSKVQKQEHYWRIDGEN